MLNKRNRKILKKFNNASINQKKQMYSVLKRETENLLLLIIEMEKKLD